MRLLLTILSLFLFSTSQAAVLTNALDVEADSLEVSTSTGNATFMGNVKLVHPTLTLTSGKLSLVSAQNNQLNTATATQNVKLVFKGGNATGSRAVWHAQKNEVHLTGNVKLSQQGNTLTGEKLIYNLNKGTARLSAGNSGRVKAVFAPRK